jgi:squalene cyclase
MAQVQTVDEAMIARTRDWLLGQQNADGSWQGDKSEFFTFQTSLVRNTAFVVWALATAGYTGSQLSSGLAYVATGLTGSPFQRNHRSPGTTLV